METTDSGLAGVPRDDIGRKGKNREHFREGGLERHGTPNRRWIHGNQRSGILANGRYATLRREGLEWTEVSGRYQYIGKESS